MFENFWLLRLNASTKLLCDLTSSLWCAFSSWMCGFESPSFSCWSLWTSFATFTLSLFSFRCRAFFTRLALTFRLPRFVISTFCLDELEARHFLGHIVD